MSEDNEADAETPDVMSAWGFWLIAAFLYAVTLYSGWLSWQRHALVEAADRFEETVGHVDAAGIKARGGTDQVSASIVVSYEIDGQRYELSTNGLDGKVDRMAPSGSASADAEALVGRFPVDEPAIVYYDPQRPSVAALTRKIEGGRDLGTAVTCLLLSLGYTGWLWRRRRQPAGRASA